MTQSVARPSNVEHCKREIFTEAILLATDFFVNYLRNFCAKDMSAARNRWSKESFDAETIRRLARTQAIE